MDTKSTPNWDIILAGESGVGKTSMILRYVNDTFSNNPAVTVNVDIQIKKMNVMGKDVVLNIWDSAGQEIFRAVTPMYFRRAHGCILVYDVTNYSSFQALSGWLEEFRRYNPLAPVIIVGNKSDEPKIKPVNLSAIRSFAREEDMDFMECSAKTGNNVNIVFDRLIQKIKRLSDIALKQNGKGNSSSERRNAPSLAASLFRNRDRDSIMLTEPDSEENCNENSECKSAEQTSTSTKKKKKKKCC